MGMEKPIMSKPVVVSSLICHSDIPMALTCFGSLVEYSQDPISFVLHDDGSLQDKDVEMLSQSFSSLTIVRRDEADELMAEMLRDYPATLKFRKQDFLAKKLLDCIHFNKSETFAYCDTDILFMRPFSGLFVLPSPNVHALMMGDISNSYCMRSWQLLRHSELQVPQFANAGLLCFRHSHYDLDFIEWFLSHEELRRIPYFVEQTAWALLSWRASCRLWDPRQIAFMTPSFVPGEQFVAGHFVKTYRSLMQNYIDIKNVSTYSNVTKVDSVAAKRCNPLDYALCEVRRPLRRALQRQKR